MLYNVSEMFETLQGEGLHSGRPCVFLRLSGCNLWKHPDIPSVTCPWCDTPQLHNSKESLTTPAIIEKLRSLASSPAHGVVITGGEPFLQLEDSLIAFLSDIFPWIDIETNGTVRPKVSEKLLYDNPKVFISCSPKLPRLSQIVVKPSWYKILIPAKRIVLDALIETGVEPSKVYLQPVEPLDKGENIGSQTYQRNIEECVSLALSNGFSVSLQLHKYLSLP